MTTDRNRPFWTRGFFGYLLVIALIFALVAYFVVKMMNAFENVD